MCNAAQQLAAQGMTIVVSSGDSGVAGQDGATCPAFVPTVCIESSLSYLNSPLTLTLPAVPKRLPLHSLRWRNSIVLPRGHG